MSSVSVAATAAATTNEVKSTSPTESVLVTDNACSAEMESVTPKRSDAAFAMVSGADVVSTSPPTSVTSITTESGADVVSTNPSASVRAADATNSEDVESAEPKRSVMVAAESTPGGVRTTSGAPRQPIEIGGSSATAGPLVTVAVRPLPERSSAWVAVGLSRGRKRTRLPSCTGRAPRRNCSISSSVSLRVQRFGRAMVPLNVTVVAALLPK